MIEKRGRNKTIVCNECNTNRNFIGIELDDKYFEIAKERIEKHEVVIRK